MDDDGAVAEEGCRALDCGEVEVEEAGGGYVRIGFVVLWGTGEGEIGREKKRGGRYVRG